MNKNKTYESWVEKGKKMPCKFCRDLEYFKDQDKRHASELEKGTHVHNKIRIWRYKSHNRKIEASFTYGNYTINFCPECGKELKKRRKKDGGQTE